MKNLYKHFRNPEKFREQSLKGSHGKRGIVPGLTRCSFGEWELPQCFHELRARLEGTAELEAQKNNPDKERGKGGRHRGTREFVKIVKPLLEFSLSDLTRAITKSLRLGHPEYEVIRSYCYPEETPEAELFDLVGREHLTSYAVRKPRLAAYDHLHTVEDDFTGNYFTVRRF